MRRFTSRLRSAGLLAGLALILALTALGLGCGEDEPSQTAVQPAVEQEPQQQPSVVQAEPQQESAQQPTQEQAVQQQSVQAQPAPVQQQEQSTASAAAQESQSEPSTSEQQAAQPSSTQQASQQQTAPEESVPEGTRLITLFGDLTEIVYALGVEEFLVARDTSSVYPPEAEQLPNLGFAGGLNAEAILALQPTLVLGTAMAGPPGVLEQLQQAGVEVLIIEPLKDLNAPQVKIRMVGEVLGIPQRAEALVLDVERRLAAVVTAAANENPLRVLHVYIRRGGLQLVSGQGNEAQTIIEAAGGIDAAAEAGIVGWQQLTPEALVAADPDVYLVMDRGLAVIGGVEGLLAIPGMAETKAGRGGHVISMADLYLLGFGPRLPEAIADLAQYLREIQAQVSGSE